MNKRQHELPLKVVRFIFVCVGIITPLEQKHSWSMPRCAQKLIILNKSNINNTVWYQWSDWTMKCFVKFSLSALECEILASYKPSFACLIVTRAAFDSLISVKYFVTARFSDQKLPKITSIEKCHSACMLQAINCKINCTINCLINNIPCIILWKYSLFVTIFTCKFKPRWGNKHF